MALMLFLLVARFSELLSVARAQLAHLSQRAEYHVLISI